MKALTSRYLQDHTFQHNTPVVVLGICQGSTHQGILLQYLYVHVVATRIAFDMVDMLSL